MLNVMTYNVMSVLKELVMVLYPATFNLICDKVTLRNIYL